MTDRSEGVTIFDLEDRFVRRRELVAVAGALGCQ